MKPLLSAPFTLEDQLIWDHVVWSVDLCAYSEWRDLPRWARESDRRDAALMLEAQRAPPAAAGYLLALAWDGEVIQVRGLAL